MSNMDKLEKRVYEIGKLIIDTDIKSLRIREGPHMRIKIDDDGDGINININLDPTNTNQVDGVPTVVFPLVLGSWKFAKKHPYIATAASMLPFGIGNRLMEYFGRMEIKKTGYKLPDVEVVSKYFRITHA